MRIRKSLFTTFYFLLGIIFITRGQGVILENNPAYLKWKQINTPHFKVIFPNGYDENAQRVANLMEGIYEPGSKTLDKRPRKLSLILQNQTSIPNGFVSLGPRRSEFFTTPPQDYNFLGTNDWFDLLAVHEFRHVVQFDKSLTGFNKFFYILFGQAAQSLWANLSVPDWFWEGDAVGIETALTPSGRGRIPRFDLVFRTNLLERGAFDYNKQHLRSFKHFVPDHYRLGYFMTTHVRNKHGAESWSKITDKAFGLPFIPFTFSDALKKVSGKNLLQTYDDMMTEMTGLWQQQLADLPLTSMTTVNQRKHSAYTSYNFPQVLNSREILVMRSGIGDIAELVKLDDQGDETVIFTPGIVNSASMLSVQNDVVAWNEFEFDPRWGAKSYSVVKLYDLKNNKHRRLGSKGRYAAAALSPDAARVATVLTTEANEYFLVVLDTGTGKEIKRFPNQDNHFFSMPRWTNDGKGIVALKSGDEGKALVLVDVESEKETVIIPASDENIGHPVPYNQYIFYNSPYSGIDNIYAINIKSLQRYQVTSAKHGAYNPTIDQVGNTIYFNDFQKDGFNVAKIPFDTTLWKPITQVEDRTVRYYEKIVEQENNHHVLDNISNQQYEVTNYAKARGFLNPHTWGPEINSTSSTIFAGLEMRDVLSTISTTLGYGYDVNEEVGSAILNVSYQGLYPILDFEFRLGNRSTFENLRNPETNAIERFNFRWKEQGANVGFRLPFTLTRSKYLTNLSYGSNIGITKVTDFNQTLRPLDQLSDGTLRSLEHSLRFNRLLKRSQRDINSKWGQTFFLNYQHTPIGGDFNGKYLATQAELFFPALAKHHSLRLRGGYQYQEIIFQGPDAVEGTYLFPSYFFFPRGYSSTTFQNFYHLKADYTLPLIYPDLALGPFLNFQRIKANLFYDYGYGKIRNFNNAFNSFGVELSTDLNILRFNQLIDLGVRLSVVPELNDVKIEFTVANLGF
ncbi:hypothetical protein QQ020_19500 [Fulvivirgaceae bacterium BMA12]|uniref:Uncharacterized protein n=1 Tax=Agaribacillus aureus TaxID=3051825 RepID=A0ABT8L946_9BACT|nr:hypothetical protein [Fulvivirgaceae bacterium BMA12]